MTTHSIEIGRDLCGPRFLCLMPFETLFTARLTDTARVAVRLPRPRAPQCLLELVPEDVAEDLLSNVDQPLQVAKDAKLGKQYLLCDYNRDGDSYR